MHVDIALTDFATISTSEDTVLCRVIQKSVIVSDHFNASRISLAPANTRRRLHRCRRTINHAVNYVETTHAERPQCGQDSQHGFWVTNDASGLMS